MRTPRLLNWIEDSKGWDILGAAAYDRQEL